MAVDPKANAAYHAAKDIQFVPGQVIWVSGIEFTVVGIQDGQLVLKPVNSKI